MYLSHGTTFTMKATPERMLAYPVYEIHQQMIVSKKIGQFMAPAVSKLDFDNVFNGTSLCLLRELSELNGGSCAEVLSVAFLVKVGARSTLEGWVCDYHTKCKVVVLADNAAPLGNELLLSHDCQPIRDSGYQAIFGDDSNARVTEEPGGTFSDFTEADFGDAEDSAWEAESECEESPKSSDGTAGDRKLLESVRIPSDDRKDISHLVGKFVDTSKYIVCVSSSDNHVQVLWKQSEQEKFKTAYAQASLQVSQASKSREFTSSRTCRLSRKGMDASIEKIKEWVAWHSTVIYASFYLVHLRYTKYCDASSLIMLMSHQP